MSVDQGDHDKSKHIEAFDQVLFKTVQYCIIYLSIIGVCVCVTGGHPKCIDLWPNATSFSGGMVTVGQREGAQ